MSCQGYLPDSKTQATSATPPAIFGRAERSAVSNAPFPILPIRSQAADGPSGGRIRIAAKSASMMTTAAPRLVRASVD